MKRAVQTWIYTADILLSMDVFCRPSPRAAQKYHMENLNEGPMNDEAANVLIPSGVVMDYDQISGTTSAMQTALMS